MKKYIDRDLALSLPWANGEYDHEHVKENSIENFIIGLEVYKEWLEYLPPADVVEVKHGKWDCIEDFYGDFYRCSVCNNDFILEEGSPEQNGYNYCPNCGAKMDGGDSE